MPPSAFIKGSRALRPLSPLGVSQTWQFPKLTLPQQLTIRGASLVTLEHIGPQEGGFVPTFSPIFSFFLFSHNLIYLEPSVLFVLDFRISWICKSQPNVQKFCQNVKCLTLSVFRRDYTSKVKREFMSNQLIIIYPRFSQNKTYSNITEQVTEQFICLEA